MRMILGFSLLLLLPSTDVSAARIQNFDAANIRVALECPGADGAKWKTATRDAWEQSGRSYDFAAPNLNEAIARYTARLSSFSVPLATAVEANFKHVLTKTNWRSDIEIQRDRFKIPEQIGDCRTHIWWLQEQIGGFDELSYVGRKDILAKLNPAEVALTLSGMKLDVDQTPASLFANNSTMSLREFSRRGQYDLFGFIYPYAHADDITYGGFDMESYVEWYDDNHIRSSTSATQRRGKWPVVVKTDDQPEWARNGFEVEFHLSGDLSKISFKYTEGKYWKLASHLKDPTLGRINPTANDYFYYPDGSMRATSDDLKTASWRAFKTRGPIPNTKFTTDPYFMWVVVDKENRPKVAYVGQNDFGDYTVCQGIAIFRPDGTLKSANVVPKENARIGCYYSEIAFWGEFDARGKLISKSKQKSPQFVFTISGEDSRTYMLDELKITSLGQIETLLNENDRKECSLQTLEKDSVTIAPKCWSLSILWPVEK